MSTIHFKKNCVLSYKIGAFHKKKEKLDIKIQENSVKYNKLIKFFKDKKAKYPIAVIDRYLDEFHFHHGAERQFVIGENETYETILVLKLEPFSDKH